MDPFDILRAHQATEERRQYEDKLSSLYCRVMCAAADAGEVLALCQPDGHGLYDALAALRSSLLECLRVEGVVLFGKAGDVLDPGRHEVTAWLAGDPVGGRVKQVQRMGLEWNGKVILKAKVVAWQAKTTENNS
jgi:molecular chaperone GrpE (heat shock protein)